MVRGSRSSFFAKGSSYALSSLTPIFTGLIVTPIVTRLLGLEQYGSLASALVIVSISLVILTLGTPSAITRLNFQKRAQREFTAVAISFNLLISIGIAFFLWVLTKILGWSSVGLIGSAISVGALGAFIAVFQANAIFEMRPLRYAYLAIGVGVLAPLTALFYIFTFGPTTDSYLNGLLSAYLVIIVLESTRYFYRNKFRLSLVRIKSALKIGLPTIPHQLSVGAAGGFTVLAAQIALDSGAAAQMQLSVFLATSPIIVISAITYSWLPELNKVRQENRSHFLSETGSSLLELATAGCLIITSLSPWFLSYLAPESYDIVSLVHLVAALGISVILAVFFLANLQVVIHSGRTASLLWMGPLMLLSGFAVSVLSGRWYGLAGTAVGFLVTYAGLAIVTSFEARKHSPIRWKPKGQVILFVLLSMSLVLAIGTFVGWQDTFGIAVRVFVTAIAAVGGLRVLYKALKGD